MKTIAVNSLRPGQIFSEPVYIDDTNLLVPANIAVRKRDIQHLISWGIETVTTDGKIVSPDKADASFGAGMNVPGKTGGGGFLSRSIRKIAAVGHAAPASAAPTTASVVRPATALVARPPAAPMAATHSAAAVPPTTAPVTRPAVPSSALPAQRRTINILALRDIQENQEDYRAYIRLIEDMDAIFGAYTGGKGLPPRAIENVAAKLLTAVREQKSRIVGFIPGGETHRHQSNQIDRLTMGRLTTGQLAKSSVNTAILSARIAMALRLPPRGVLQVICGALFRDIGMLALPKNTPGRGGELSAGELRLIQSHPSISRKIVREKFGFSNDAALAVYQHHERRDGNGYPEKLAGKDIDIRARIVAVADVFESMVSGSSCRMSVEGSRALKTIYADNGRRFDPAVVRAFVRTMGIYPAGSFVKLNNNALCRVLSAEAGAPLRPRVEVLIDENNRTFRPGEGKVYDLIQEGSIFIEQALDPREIAKLS